jgi:hypothetical protein
MKRIASNPLIGLFVILSLADFALTWWLIERSGRQVFEDNPVADELLTYHGWLGLALFKVATVLVVIVATSMVARRRPRTARHVLRFACAAAAFVILHGTIVGQTAKTRDEINAEDNQNLAEFNREAQQRSLDSLAYANLVNDVCNEVISGRFTLAEAVDQLMSSELTQDPRRQQSLMACHAGQGLRQCLANQIMRFIQMRGASVAVKATPMLEVQYSALFMAAGQVFNSATLRPLSY